ncbi:2',3'-cyclic-nucleotide 3'-phosphodiesterase [Lactarius quietus]|nr:2',3'-cyclic-nucleotide 3'-phosphodiesterase [Lactarius quietus]
MGISLWLVPSAPESALLQQLMNRHPKPGADHSFPHFHPHVTLATLRPTASDSAARDSTVLSLREALPLGQRTVPVRFARVVAGDHYFRSVFVALAPSPELVHLRAALAAAGTPHPPAFPHLSLYYIADEEADTRERLVQELERENVVRLAADGQEVVLECGGTGAGGDGIGSGTAEGAMAGFTGTQIWIVDCEGPVEGWKVLDKILLAKSDS